MKLDIQVHDFPGDGLAGDDDTAAVVVCGAAIAINPALEGDDLRADVLAMALEVAAIMTNRKTGDPGEIYAPGGFVVITRNRVQAPPQTGPGSLATLIARKCGRDTASAVFRYYVPAFDFCFPVLADDGQG
jgi:hypothetical protein